MIAEAPLPCPEQVRHAQPDLRKRRAPCRAERRIVVESTVNCSWWVDGPQGAGYDEACPAQPLGLALVTGAKVTTDRRDALVLAKLLKGGLRSKASVYPQDTRPIRDLLR